MVTAHGKGPIMPANVLLRNTLYETRDTLHRLRSLIFTRGQMRLLGDIDALIGIAESETAHFLAQLPKCPEPNVAKSPAV